MTILTTRIKILVNFIHFLTQARKWSKLQKSAIYKPVDQMEWNKYRWKACEKMDSIKQWKQNSEEDEKMTKI